MPIEYQFVPLETWPGPRSQFRGSSNFRSTFSQTCDLLDRELVHLNAKNIVIQADCDRSWIRLDGQLRSDAKLRSPGIVLTFDSKHGPLSYPCDRYSDWKDNLRAIALSLEALRAVNRYGVTRQAEQYKGWQKLPPPVSHGYGTARDAANFLAAMVPEFDQAKLLASAEAYREAYRAAAHKLHPDRQNGSDDNFKLLQSAKQLLDKHHGL